MNRLNRQVIFLVFLLLTAHGAQSIAIGREPWTRVRSKNFVLVGNASAKEIREVAVRLEQFRDAFARLFTGFRFASNQPTTVIVFNNHESFEPYKPVYQGKPAHVSGYFQSGEDVNYIALTAEQQDDDPYRVIFHEYVHLLLHNTIPRTPAWFDEGLAEYYSTFAVADGGRRVMLGKVIPSHLELLRHSELLPLKTLLSVDHQSPYYNEQDKTSIFYAQSWALVHFLILGEDQQHRLEFGRFLNMMRGGARADSAFKQAFQIDYETLAGKLLLYLQRRSFPRQEVTFSQRILINQELKTDLISEADALGYLGDLLLHTGRVAEAATVLERALEIDDNAVMAHASLGILRIKQKQFNEAIEHLEKARAGDPNNYLIHYYCAFALSRLSMDDELVVSSYSAETADKIREELTKTIALEPNFPAAYSLLAFVNLVREERLDESVQLLEKALSLAPDRDDSVFIMAQIYLRQQDFESVRRVLQPLLRDGASETSRKHAEALLASAKHIEEQLARLRDAAALPDPADGSTVPDSSNLPAELKLRKLEPGELRIRGWLKRVDCSPEQVIFMVDVMGRTVKLVSARLEHVRFTTFTPDVKGQMTCGVRQQSNPVVVTYRPAKQHREGIEGEAISVEFLPHDFNLTEP